MSESCGQAVRLCVYPTLCNVTPAPWCTLRCTHESMTTIPYTHRGNWSPGETKKQVMVDLQFLEIAVRNVVGTPIRHRIELDAMRELHLGSGLGVTANLRTACVLRPASKGLSPELELSEAGGARALLRWSRLLLLSLLPRSNTR